MGAAQEGLPEFEYAEDFGQQWAATGGRGFAGSFQGLLGQLGSSMAGFPMPMVRLLSCPSLHASQPHSADIVLPTAIAHTVCVCSHTHFFMRTACNQLFSTAEGGP